LTDSDSNRRHILVTDGEQRATLAVVRSLGAAGHAVHVCAPVPHSLAGASRFAASEQAVASALTAPDYFADEINTLIDEKKIDVVIPMTEPALLALLPRRERFPGVLIPFVGAESFAAISDKQALLDAAKEVGIHVPVQTVVPDAAAVGSVDVTEIQYPVVVKPARSVSTGAGDRLKLSVRHAASAVELRAILTGMDERAYPLLLQQRIIGEGVGIFVLVWDGELVAQFAHRRIREKPPSGGISVYRESIPVDPDLLRMSLALLARFHWQGVAMVEFKIDARTGTPYLMEINGRFWGSLQLAIDSGVDFPRLLIEAATGQHPATITRFRTGVRSRWFWGDVDHLLARLRRTSEQLALPPGAPSRSRAFRDFFSHHTGDVSEIFRRDDFRPFLRESVQWFQQLGR
jgi:predicted ATP-grasp superfamily ATP-dependent carboligase